MKAIEVLIKLEPKQLSFLYRNRKYSRLEAVGSTWYDFINQTFTWADCIGGRDMWLTLSHCDYVSSAKNQIDKIMDEEKKDSKKRFTNEQLKSIYGLENTHAIYKFCKENGVSNNPSNSDWVNQYIYDKFI
jgi:hypothetical protein